MKKISTSTLQRPMVICLLAAFCCLLWGSAFPAVKIGYGLLSISSADSAEQLIFAGLRFLFAGVVTVLYPSLICICVSFLMLIWLFLFKRKDMVREMQKKFRA